MKSKLKKSKNPSQKPRPPFSKATILAVIIFLIASGGWGGYKVVKNNQKYGTDFETRPHKVARVIDGDTFVVENNIKVRLIGLDAPEVGNCYAVEATNFLKNLIKDKEIYLQKDISGTDDFGRLLRYAILRNDNPEEDDILINDLLIRSGYAMDYKSAPDNRYRDLFSSSRNIARRENLGIWKECPKEAFEQLQKRDRRSANRIENDSAPENHDCIIKGNISTQGHGKTYFLPGCSNYSRVHIDPSRGEKYFCTEAEAKKAGFTISANCLNNFPNLK